MPITESFRDFLVDQLAGLGELTLKRMFGGLGLYRAGAFFAVVDDDTLYFRVDDTTRPDFVKRGMSPFRPLRRDPTKVSMNYFQCPADVLDDADELVVWARRAVRAATSPTAAVAKRTRKPTTKKASVPRPAKRKRAAKRTLARSR